MHHSLLKKSDANIYKLICNKYESNFLHSFAVIRPSICCVCIIDWCWIYSSHDTVDSRVSFKFGYIISFFGQILFTHPYPTWQFLKAPEGSARKFEAQKQLAEIMAHRAHVDSSMKLIGKLLFGIEKGPEVLKTIRSAGKPLVDDWSCLKSLVTFIAHSPH